MKPLTKSKRYRVYVSGISDKVSPKFAFTFAGSKQDALVSTVRKIAREVQSEFSPYSKKMLFKHGSFRVYVAPESVRLLIEYLLANPELYKVEEMG